MEPDRSSEGDRASDAADAGDAVARAMEAAAAGETGAAEQLLPLVYDQLRALASARMRRIPPGQTLQPTALVHEAWARIADRRPEGWANRAEFFHAAARAMRDIIVEDARRKDTVRHGGRWRRVRLDADAELAIAPPGSDVLDLDDALARLAAAHPDAARVVDLRYFVGLTAEEVAEITGVSVSTVERLWRFARAWLREAIERDEQGAKP